MFTERLAKLLKENKIKNTELADHLKISKSAVSKWLSGEAEPRPETLRQMAKFFNVSAGYLINDEDMQGADPSTRGGDIFPAIVYTREKPSPIKGTVWAPIYETSISSIPGVQDIASEKIIGWHTIPESMADFAKTDEYPTPFTMKVAGNSMYPVVQPGDYITIRPASYIIPEPQRMYAVKINDTLTDTFGIIVKRVQLDDRRGIYLLKSDNPDYPVYVVESDKATIVGRIVSLWRPL